MSVDQQRNAEKARRRLSRPTGWTFGVRTISVGLFDAMVVFALPQLVSNQLWVLLVLLVGTTIAVNWAYLSPRTDAARWLTPGLVLMAIFVVFPVVYTFYISVTNWATGNVLQKDQVIERLEAVPLATGDAPDTRQLAVYRDGDELALLVFSDTEPAFAGLPRDDDAEQGEPTPAVPDELGVLTEPPATLGDFELLEGLSVAPLANRLQELAVDLPGGGVARVETLSTVAVRTAGGRFTYDADADTLFDNQLGTLCTAGEGTFFCDGVPEAEVDTTARQRNDSTITCSGGVCDEVPLFAISGNLPGWREVVGFDNYADIFANERIRAPFARVLAWNVVFSLSSVLMTFALGLGLAIALQDESLKGRAVYRSIFIVPYAIPAFLSIFIWRGLLNTEFGKVNSGLESIGIAGVDWLGSPTGAMAAVLLVNLWLGFPYMFLISSGALTSIPDELLEAARVDGASPWKSFRAITLPLLLVSTAPLLIGAFAFNFNNFVLIFLLTQGGPPLAGYDVPVGATDLLISFTFNLAQGAGRGQQFGLSSAIVVLIFIVLATVSASSFRLTRRLEDIYE